AAGRGWRPGRRTSPAAPAAGPPARPTGCSPPRAWPGPAGRSMHAGAAAWPLATPRARWTVAWRDRCGPAPIMHGRGTRPRDGGGGVRGARRMRSRAIDIPTPTQAEGVPARGVLAFGDLGRGLG